MLFDLNESSNRNYYEMTMLHTMLFLVSCHDERLKESGLLCSLLDIFMRHVIRSKHGILATFEFIAALFLPPFSIAS